IAPRSAGGGPAPASPRARVFRRHAVSFSVCPPGARAGALAVVAWFAAVVPAVSVGVVLLQRLLSGLHSGFTGRVCVPQGHSPRVGRPDGAVLGSRRRGRRLRGRWNLRVRYARPQPATNLAPQASLDALEFLLAHGALLVQ